MRRKKAPPAVSVPQEPQSPYSLSVSKQTPHNHQFKTSQLTKTNPKKESGTFRDGDFAINRTGIIQSPLGTPAMTGEGMQGLLLSDIKITQVLGRGAGGTVSKAVIN